MSDLDVLRMLVKVAFLGLVGVVVWLVELLDELRRDRRQRHRQRRGDGRRDYPRATPYEPPPGATDRQD